MFQNSDSKPTTFDLLHAYSDYLITVTAENDEGAVQTTRTFSTLTKRMCNDFTYLFLCSGFFLYGRRSFERIAIICCAVLFFLLSI